MPFKKGKTPEGAKPFKKGVSGNPSGRPEGAKSRSTVLNKWLSAELDIVNPITKDKQRGTVEDEVILSLITKARKGDVGAIKEVLDTMYGKLSDKHEIGNADGSDMFGPLAEALTKVYSARTNSNK